MGDACRAGAATIVRTSLDRLVSALATSIFPDTV
jgi:hypothetical protein